MSYDLALRRGHNPRVPGGSLVNTWILKSGRPAPGGLGKGARDWRGAELGKGVRGSQHTLRAGNDPG